jgi:hypothetical protein
MAVHANHGFGGLEDDPGFVIMSFDGVTGEASSPGCGMHMGGCGVVCMAFGAMSLIVDFDGVRGGVAEAGD